MAFYSRLIHVVSLLSISTAVRSLEFGDHWVEEPGPFSQNFTEPQCQAPYTSANATGTVKMQNYAHAQMENVTWTVAVSQPAGDAVANTNVSLYLGTPSGKDLRSNQPIYSACAILFEDIPDNLVRRGQDDDGTCTQTFSKECVDALQYQAALTGYWLTVNPDSKIQKNYVL